MVPKASLHSSEYHSHTQCHAHPAPRPRHRHPSPPPHQGSSPQCSEGSMKVVSALDVPSLFAPVLPACGQQQRQQRQQRGGGAGGESISVPTIERPITPPHRKTARYSKNPSAAFRTTIPSPPPSRRTRLHRGAGVGHLSTRLSFSRLAQLRRVARDEERRAAQPLRLLQGAAAGGRVLVSEFCLYCAVPTCTRRCVFCGPG